jgi:hypothetical protein
MGARTTAQTKTAALMEIFEQSALLQFIDHRGLVDLQLSFDLP